MNHNQSRATHTMRLSGIVQNVMEEYWIQYTASKIIVAQGDNKVVMAMNWACGFITVEYMDDGECKVSTVVADKDMYGEKFDDNLVNAVKDVSRQIHSRLGDAIVAIKAG